MRATSLASNIKLAVSTVPCSLIRVQGYYAGAADAWLQIHDSAAEPGSDEGVVPVKSYALPAASPYHWGFDAAPLCLQSGCYIAVSLTEGTYTAATFDEGTYLDVMADYGPYDFKPTDYYTAGNLSTGRNSLAVWTSANGPKRLYHVDFANSSSAPAVWLFIYALSSFAGKKPIQRLGPKDGIGQVGVVTFDFGGDGFAPFSKDSEGTESQGCYLVVSAEPESLVGLIDSLCYIRAYYK